MTEPEVRLSLMAAAIGMGLEARVLPQPSSDCGVRNESHS